MNMQDLIQNRGNKWVQEVLNGTQMYDTIYNEKKNGLMADEFQDPEKEKEMEALRKWQDQMAFVKAEMNDFGGVINPEWSEFEKLDHERIQKESDYSGIAKFLELNNNFEHEKENMMNEQQLEKYNDYVERKKLRANPVKSS